MSLIELLRVRCIFLFIRHVVTCKSNVLHGGAVGNAATSLLQRSWFDTDLRLQSVCSFACSPMSAWLSSRLSAFLSAPKTCC